MRAAVVTAPDHPTETGAPSTRVVSLPASRLVAFSDAVVAIGITLLVLPLIDLVPEAVRSGDPAVDVVIGNLVPIGSFLLSFAVIWRIWTVHHQVFATVETVSGAVSFVNMGWLACIVFLPFPVDLIGTYGAEPFVLGLYVGVLLLSSITLAVMAFTLRRSQRDGAAPPRRVAEQVAGNAVGLMIAFVIVVTVPSAGFWPLLLLLLDGPVLALVHRATNRRPSRTGRN